MRMATSTGDDRLLDLIRKSIQRTRDLTDSSRQHAAAVKQLSQTLAGTRIQVEQSLQQGEGSLQRLGQRLSRMELESQEVLRDAGKALQSLRQEHEQVRSAHNAAQADFDAELVRLRKIRNDAVARVREEVTAARAALEETTQFSKQTADALVKSSAEVQAQVAEGKAAIAAARAELETMAAEALAQYQPLSEALLQNMQVLHVDFEETRKQTRARLEKLVEIVTSSTAKSNAVVVRRFTTELGEQMTLLADGLDEAIRQLKTLAADPRRTADTEVLTTIQKIRETFDPLQLITKVFKEAEKAALC